jgi:cytochrome c-type biogenesis protein
MKLPLLFLEGLLAFLSPCMLPMLPIYIAYLAGGSKEGSRAAIVNTAGFVLGFTVIFTLMGATATALGSLLNAHRLLLTRVSGAVIIIFGLHFLGVLKMDFLGVQKKLRVNVTQTGFLGALLFGAVFSLGWTPCLGPFLGSALLMAGSGKTVVHGMFYLFVFSMGIGVPYMLAAVAFGTLEGLFGWFEAHGNQIRIVSGALLVLMGFLLAFDLFGYWASLF